MFDISSVLYRIIGAVIAFTIHEYVKAAVSVRLGDQIPTRERRVTLNPVRHFEPIGFFLLIIFGFGWGKPVNTSSMNYKDKKRGTLFTYISPSAANLLAGILLAAIAGLFERLVPQSSGTGAFPAAYAVLSVLYNAAYINIGYFFINILPVYPLDGSKVLSVFLKPAQVVKMAAYDKILQFVLLVFIAMGFAGTVISPAAASIINLFSGLAFMF